MRPTLILALIACGGLALTTACSKPTSPEGAAPGAPVAMTSQAAADLAAYQELVRSGSHEFAVTMGREVLRKHPGSAAAAEVNRTLPAVEAQAESAADGKRMAALWDYQQGTQSGGKQSAASIYSSQPGSAAERARLILRRHSDWGESAYVFGTGRGFKCAAPCRVSIRYGDQPFRDVRAHLPDTGEPALFIDELAAFLAGMKSAREIEIRTRLADGTERSYVFETGGFDAAKWLPL